MNAHPSFTRRVMLLVTAGIALGPRARATLYVDSSFDELLSAATLVPLARVSSAASAWSAGRIVTRLALAPEEIFKGTVSGSLELLVPGGTVDGITMRVLGYPTLHAGDRAILVLSRSRVDGVHRLVGAARGHLPIVRDHIRAPTGALVPLADFRPALRAAIARAGAPR